MFYAVPPFSTATWQTVNAIFWVAKFFLGQMKQEKPDYLVFIRDAKGDTFRSEIYTDYKATRERMPDDLRSQVDGINDMVNKMWFEVIEIPWFEADDVIATLAKKFGDDYQVYILTWDKDLHALVTENVKIYDTLKRKVYGPADTKEKFEVEPKYVSDYLGIVGDSSDNFPGITGIGPKKAVVLINNIGSVERIYEVIDEIESWKNIDEIDGITNLEEVKKILSGKTLEKFIEGREMSIISKKLATLHQDVPLNGFSLDNYVFHPDHIVTPEVIELFKIWEFKSLVNENEQTPLKKWEDLGLWVKIVGDEEGLKELEKSMVAYTEIILDTETTSINPMKADLVWVSIYLDDGHIYYINLLHKWPQVSQGLVKNFLQHLFSLDVKIIGHNIKYDLEVIERFLHGKNDTLTLGKTLQSSLF